MLVGSEIYYEPVFSATVISFPAGNNSARRGHQASAASLMTGRVIRKVVPWLGTLSTSMDP